MDKLKHIKESLAKLLETDFTRNSKGVSIPLDDYKDFVTLWKDESNYRRIYSMYFKSLYGSQSSDDGTRIYLPLDVQVDMNKTPMKSLSLVKKLENVFASVVNRVHDKTFNFDEKLYKKLEGYKSGKFINDGSNPMSISKVLVKTLDKLIKEMKSDVDLETLTKMAELTTLKPKSNDVQDSIDFWKELRTGSDIRFNQFYNVKRLLQLFQTDEVRSYKKGLEYMLVISYHPKDISHISTKRNWTSCQAITNSDSVVHLDVIHGTIAFYLTTTDDTELDKPIGRAIAKQFVPIGATSDTQDFFIVQEHGNYGTIPTETEESFYNEITKFVRAFNNKHGYNVGKGLKMKRIELYDDDKTNVVSNDKLGMVDDPKFFESVYNGYKNHFEDVLEEINSPQSMMKLYSEFADIDVNNALVNLNKMNNGEDLPLKVLAQSMSAVAMFTKIVRMDFDMEHLKLFAKSHFSLNNFPNITKDDLPTAVYNDVQIALFDWIVKIGDSLNFIKRYKSFESFATSSELVEDELSAGWSYDMMIKHIGLRKLETAVPNPIVTQCVKFVNIDAAIPAMFGAFLKRNTKQIEMNAGSMEGLVYGISKTAEVSLNMFTNPRATDLNTLTAGVAKVIYEFLNKNEVNITKQIAKVICDGIDGIFSKLIANWENNLLFGHF